MKILIPFGKRKFRILWLFSIDNFKILWEYNKSALFKIRFYHEPYEPEGFGGWDDRQEYLERYTLDFFHFLQFVYFPPEPTREEKWELKKKQWDALSQNSV